MERLTVSLEDIQHTPPPPPPSVYISVPSPVNEEPIRLLKQEAEDLHKTIELLKSEVHRKEQRFWEEEANSPPSTSIFRTYETQKELFLFLYDYRSGQSLSKLEFEALWRKVEVIGKGNLLVEMLCRNVLKLSDPLAAVLIMGDVGARVTMYYMELELRIREKRGRELRPVLSRVTHFKDYGPGITHDIYSLSETARQGWTMVLKDLVRDFHHEDTIRGAMEAAVVREKKGRIPEINPNSYLYAYSLSLQRMESTIQSLERQGNPMFALSQTDLAVPAPGWRSNATIADLPIVEPTKTEQDYRFQGNYRALFKAGDAWETEVPIISWEAIAWVLKDYGLSREETEPWDVTYRRVSRQWNSEPPPAVKLDPRFCNCPRRNKWDPSATVDSVEYNWPLIPGEKRTPQECYDTYCRFWREHKECEDPVCYRAAIFCRALAEWCITFHIWIDVNIRQEGPPKHPGTLQNPEFWIFLKLQYQCTRPNRILEAMCSMHFILGAHHTMINELGNKRMNPIDRFLQDQRRRNPIVVQNDIELATTVERMDRRLEARQYRGKGSSSRYY